MAPDSKEKRHKKRQRSSDDAVADGSIGSPTKKFKALQIQEPDTTAVVGSIETSLTSSSKKKDKKERKEKKDKKNKAKKKVLSAEIIEDDDSPAPEPPELKVQPLEYVPESDISPAKPRKPAKVTGEDDLETPRKRKKKKHKDGVVEEPTSGEPKTTKPLASSNSAAEVFGGSPPHELSGLSHNVQIRAPSDAPASPPFPFFDQRVSLYLPLFPCGFADPLQSLINQQLEPLKNRYVAKLGGVLLGYKNPRMGSMELDSDGNYASIPGETAGVEGLMGSANLQCINEYAVGFGYLRVEVSLFVPKRGEWMEGNLALQSESHIGLVCWGMFNASIEASRLPKGWKWVSHSDDDLNSESSTEPGAGAAAEDDDDKMDVDGEGLGENGHNGTGVETNGYWVDEAGAKVRGKLRFRIRNFDVGVGGGHGFLSLEGTMLSAADERELTRTEREKLRERRAAALGRGSTFFREGRRMDEWGVTTLGEVEKEDVEPKQQLEFKQARSTEVTEGVEMG